MLLETLEEPILAHPYFATENKPCYLIFFNKIRIYFYQIEYFAYDVWEALKCLVFGDGKEELVKTGEITRYAIIDGVVYEVKIDLLRKKV